MDCPICGKKMKHRDYVKRIVKYQMGVHVWIDVEREYCVTCRVYRRILPKYLIVFKHYRREIIFGVAIGHITANDECFEDYPCEMTMKRWTQLLPLLI